ncbi:helix-turn-helix domain-containing protein [Lacticaseibacillus casei]|uniref:Helix-turn-helix transcriptional regulator n=1 Tax=Lacticaseibacillus huelsenbergensis TaxID=3035291 RepID=A0ABY8DP61_9LACO|nr:MULTISPECIES: helix-turn-helix transcriptional regulator [Lacticaseibacillus]MDG3061569.1 helix-turn-helix transcriptional regulator [Lacticaseibacillus sp. BCRC 81376]QVI37972.1 helix-turn-helix transcriptional regulator [Lacticaseibacillus casei]QXG59761.1 helix-turn-helix domain-containing protein [Lacticaseibacillus casei]WFB38773.1 helix-turn-helix transcriptional regulator [Lacticaseibacillus huelsenbergensis]WFB43167.1 helix-turn-helix transcriptional regulator [Lacticaseibacillus hu
MSLPEQVAQRIRDLRMSKHISQEQLANMAGMDASMLARIENGRRPNIKLATLERIVKALGVNYHEFFTIEDDENPQMHLAASVVLLNNPKLVQSLQNIVDLALDDFRDAEDKQ